MERKPCDIRLPAVRRLSDHLVPALRRKRLVYSIMDVLIVLGVMSMVFRFHDRRFSGAVLSLNRPLMFPHLLFSPLLLDHAMVWKRYALSGNPPFLFPQTGANCLLGDCSNQYCNYLCTLLFVTYGRRALIIVRVEILQIWIRAQIFV